MLINFNATPNLVYKNRENIIQSAGRVKKSTLKLESNTIKNNLAPLLEMRESRE